LLSLDFNTGGARPCYATTAQVTHFEAGYSNEPQPHIIRFGRPPV
jgi:hypothetical protein